MLNPLSRNQPLPTDDLPGDGNDIESPMSSQDASGYIGKRKTIHFLEIDDSYSFPITYSLFFRSKTPGK